jgi:hypothetical protein
MIAKLNLTPSQKKEVYQYAIGMMKTDLSCGNSPMGLCWTINSVVHDLKYCAEIAYGSEIVYGSAMMHNFPEVYKYKPVKRDWHSNHYWFSFSKDGMQKRIDILEKAIIRVEKLESL